ncbi:MAG: protein-disulfide reductase DsbD family protein [Bacteroidales bacterium]|jgi:thiol:disulfide interchange protein|nr:protein-disulfide reductase DsbD family protein [Bacteroidales bacterium]
MKRLNVLRTKGIALITMLLLSVFVNAQQINPVSWTFSTEQISEQEFYLIMSGNIEADWHMYTIDIEEGGPMPMYIEFDKSDDYKLVGGVLEFPKPKEVFDDVFNVTVKYHEKTVQYKQKIKLNTEKSFTIEGLLDGQACYDIDGRCVLVTEDMEFNIKPVKIESSEETQAVKNQIKSETNQTDSADDEEDLTSDDKEENAEEDHVSDKKASNPTSTVAQAGTKEDSEEKEKGILGFLLMAIGGGLLGVLTPCVFPMIPMTVSFFLQGQSSRAAGIMKALIFGLSIIFLYTLVGLIVSLTSAGADLTSILSTSWVANAIFFVLFVIFSISFFGLFEITLPTGLANKADQQVDKGGLIASFFMAVTLVIVSFSCTGPIVGAILVKGAASGSWLEPTIGMMGFGFGFALPFTLLAVSPNLLKKLPKSGGWMNAVKVVFAFILLAFSMKFLSNIDQTYNLNFLSRDLYIAIWIVLFTLMGFYLLGKIKFSHDSDLKHVGIFRLFVAIASFSFVLYLLPGMFGAKLTPIASVLPPMTAQNFELKAGGGSTVEIEEALCEEPKHTDVLHYSNNIQGYFDYQQGLDCAKEKNKPLLVYFSGHGCSNCKQMQSFVWEDTRVQDYLNNKVIITKLLTDERKELPESEWYESEMDGRMKKTVGKQNRDFQISRFNMNSQPFYVLINPKTGEKLISETMEYEKDPEVFIEWLDKGLAAMK